MGELLRVSAWFGLPELITDLGADPKAVFAEAGLSLQDLSSPDNYLPVRAFARTVNAANRATGRTDIGLLSTMRGGHQTLGMLGIAARNAHSLRQALELGSRFISIHRPGGRMTLVPLPGTNHEFLEITIADLDDPEMLQIPERILAMTYKVNEFFAGDLFRPLEFHFTHEQISPAESYIKVFGKLPKFGQSAVGMVLDSTQLDEPLPNRSSELSELATTHLGGIAARRGGGIGDKTRTLTRILIELGDCRPADVARSLGMEERTLQRRLREEGLTFEGLRDDARRELAEVFLRQDKFSLTEIALILGYADSSSLSRSCRRWFGVSPSEHQRLIKNA